MFLYFDDGSRGWTESEQGKKFSTYTTNTYYGGRRKSASDHDTQWLRPYMMVMRSQHEADSCLVQELMSSHRSI